MNSKIIDINVSVLRKEAFQAHDAIISKVRVLSLPGNLTTQQISDIEGLQVVASALYLSLVTHRNRTPSDIECFDSFRRTSRRLTGLLLRHISNLLKPTESHEAN